MNETRGPDTLERLRNWAMLDDMPPALRDELDQHITAWQQAERRLEAAFGEMRGIRDTLAKDGRFDRTVKAMDDWLADQEPADET